MCYTKCHNLNNLSLKKLSAYVENYTEDDI